MPETKLTQCDACESVIQEPKRTCKRCLNIAYQRDLDDLNANHIGNQIANGYGVSIEMFESIKDKVAQLCVEDHVDEWASEHDFSLQTRIDKTDTWVAAVYHDGDIAISDVVKVNKKYYLRNGKMQRDNFSKRKGRIIAKLRIYNLWVGGAF